MFEVVERIRGGLIVSCQAGPQSPLDSPEILAALARCAEIAAAAGIRANDGSNISAVAAAVALPIIGIKKRDIPGFDVYITPEPVDAREAAAAGASIIAVDATLRRRPVPFSEMVRCIHDDLRLPVMADCATFEDGLAAAEAGADLVATTMSGYTAETAHLRGAGPDLDLVSRLAGALAVPVVCEGRIHTPDQARAAMESGAFAVVVGTAITAPMWIAGQFVQAIGQTNNPAIRPVPSPLT